MVEKVTVLDTECEFVPWNPYHERAKLSPAKLSDFTRALWQACSHSRMGAGGDLNRSNSE